MQNMQPCHRPVVAWQRLLPTWASPGDFGAVVDHDPSSSFALISSKPSPSGSSNAERLWRKFFADPSQWCDKRASKTNTRLPDFKHKITNESLWIDGWYNPSWVRDVLEKRESAIKGMHKAKAQDMPEKSAWEMLSLEVALNYLERMPEPPSGENFACILHKCRKKKNLACVQRLHAYMCTRQLDAHRSLGNYLVPLLVEVGKMSDAQQVFDRLIDRNEYSWTSLITGYIECGQPQHALNLYQKMQEDCVHPNGHTFVALLKACTRMKDVDKGQEIHAEIAKKGLEGDLYVGSTLVDMYAKCGSLEKAQEVFDMLPVRNMVSWTSLIAGYANHGLGEEALNCFERMQLEGVSPDAFTFVCSLKACGSIGAIDKGEEIHAELARNGLERKLLVGSTLVDMYSKCGLLAKAQEVFDKLPVRDVVAWTALMAGYAHLGDSENVFHMLHRMRGEGIKPNGVTFLHVLTVCSHTGLLEKGQKYFEAMSRDYGITRTIEHYTSMVDLLGRAGQLDEAVAMMRRMPFPPNHIMWHIVLCACQKWGNVEFGRHAFEHAVQLDQYNTATYVLMSNIYADAHMQEDVKKIEAMRVKIASMD